MSFWRQRIFNRIVSVITGSFVLIGLLIIISESLYSSVKSSKKALMVRLDTGLAMETTGLPILSFIARSENVSAKNNSKLIVILSYQRSGSTLLGQIFNKNPNAFYQYEPLDALYSSIYGTQYGWNVPTDITHFRNGTKRKPPQKELNKVSDFLLRFLNCQIDKLPTETLIHRYLPAFPEQFLSSKAYIKCLATSKLRSMIKYCSPSSQMRKYCGSRFGMVDNNRSNECQKLMSNPAGSSKSISNVTRLEFRKHYDCKIKLRRVIDKKCTHHLVESCQQKSLRAVKVVRGRMVSMKALLSREPHMYVIHLMRDPRAVTLSRSKFCPSASGAYTMGARNRTDRLVREATMYCESLAEDIKERKILEAMYPGRILSIVYDNFVTNLKENLKNIYQFLDLPMSNIEAIAHSLQVEARPGGSKNASAFIPSQSVAKWKIGLSADIRRRILNACGQIFKSKEEEWLV